MMIIMIIIIDDNNVALDSVILNNLNNLNNEIMVSIIRD